MATQPIYQFYAELNDYAPKMWRRFQVANNITMARLGYILMTLFEMQAGHLFSIDVPIKANFRAYMLERCTQAEFDKYFADGDRFDQARRQYGIVNEFMSDFSDGEDEKLLDATDAIVKNVVYQPGDKMLFTYDFGDNWEVSLALEQVVVDKDLPGKELPRVLEGAGYGIIEDCGGVPGLEEIAKAFKKKKGAAYKEYCEWLGQNDLDLARFDIDDMNFRLKKVPRIYADIYEYRLEPTKRSIDLLERRYLKKSSGRNR